MNSAGEATSLTRDIDGASMTTDARTLHKPACSGALARSSAAVEPLKRSAGAGRDPALKVSRRSMACVRSRHVVRAGRQARAERKSEPAPLSYASGLKGRRVTSHHQEDEISTRLQSGARPRRDRAAALLGSVVFELDRS